MFKSYSTLIKLTVFGILVSCASTQKPMEKDALGEFKNDFNGTHEITFGYNQNASAFVFGKNHINFSTTSKNVDFDINGYCKNQKQIQPFTKNGTLIVPPTIKGIPLNYASDIQNTQRHALVHRTKELLLTYLHNQNIHTHFGAIEDDKKLQAVLNNFMTGDSQGVDRYVMTSYNIKNRDVQNINELKNKKIDSINLKEYARHGSAPSYVETAKKNIKTESFFIETNSTFILTYLSPHILKTKCSSSSSSKNLFRAIVDSSFDSEKDCTSEYESGSGNYLDKLFFTHVYKDNPADSDSFLGLAEYKDLDSLFNMILLIPEKEQIELFGESFGYKNEQLDPGEILKNNEKMWANYLKKFVYIQEDQTIDPQIINIKVGLDLSLFCAYGRSKDSLISK